MTTKKTVVVFGASGRMGQAQVIQLLRANHRPRAVTRHAKLFDRPEFAGVEVVSGDYDNPASLRAACVGADALFYSPPTMASFDTTWRHSCNLVEAAKSVAIKQFIHNTTMWAPDKPCGEPLYDFCLSIENLVVESGLPVIVFRPVLFMDNFLTLFAKPSLIRESVYRYCQRPGLIATWISMDDLAKFMTAALGRDDLSGRRFVIGGPENLPVEEAMAIVGEAMGKKLRYEYETPYNFGARMHGIFKMENEVSVADYASFFDSFYTFNNESPLHPFQAETASVLAELPVNLTTLREWAMQQDWTTDPSEANSIGSRSG